MASRGLSIENPLGMVSLPTRISDERCLEITQKLKAKIATKQDHEELAMGFIRYGVAIASRYSRRLPNKTNDFISCAMFAIWKLVTEASDRLQEEPDDCDLSCWMGRKMYAYIKKQCQSFMMADHVVTVSDRTIRHRKQHGKEELNIAKTFPLSVLEAHDARADACESFDDAKPSRNQSWSRVPFTRPPNRLRDLREMLQSIIKDEIDKHIVNMRIEGFRDVEIAESLGKSTAYINKRRAELESRFERLERATN